ncbi:UbiA family prenyltransferase [Agarivorans sp. QJM3NY_25]|uniref:UbiA family prenyltransferase n=1 Tax=Agarivorans sp. QJM3NY_25 TaxID=3421430 RepID=UPI003D7E3936
MSVCPLVVDLDGTLLKTDLLFESLMAFLRRHPLQVLRLFWWVIRGKAYFKHQLANWVELDVTVMPYHLELLDYLKEQQNLGRKLILATGSDFGLATQVSEHLGCFDSTFGSSLHLNLVGNNKRVLLDKLYGAGRYDYAGNSESDLSIWGSARRALVVNAKQGVLKKAGVLAPIERVFLPERGVWRGAIRAMRLHQWAKNSLVMVPLFFAHQFADPSIWLKALAAFVACGLCASSVYLLNDLLDLTDDRHHHSKRRRPFAAGQTPIPLGLLMIPLLLMVTAVIVSWLPPMFGKVLAGYYLLTMLYSFYLKRVVLLDVLALAMLYTFRIIAGGFAVGIALSFWLLSFSVFFFLSLAIAKRYTELMVAKRTQKQELRGRGYETDDITLIASLGSASGYLSVLVLALYINSPTITALYTHPQLIWLVCPVLLYWISRVWVIAHRGNMHDDPIMFALKDPTSLVLGSGIVSIILMAI